SWVRHHSNHRPALPPALRATFRQTSRRRSPTYTRCTSLSGTWGKQPHSVARSCFHEICALACLVQVSLGTAPELVLPTPAPNWPRRAVSAPGRGPRVSTPLKNFKHGGSC